MFNYELKYYKSEGIFCGQNIKMIVVKHLIIDGNYGKAIFAVHVRMLFLIMRIIQAFFAFYHQSLISLYKMSVLTH